MTPDTPTGLRPSRTLVLMRHGKSGYPNGVPDHRRPLADRGRHEAALAGDWIRAEVGDVGAVICSTSTRTRETLAATAIDAPTRFEDTVYGGSPEAILQEITVTDVSVSTLLVVGHEPGIPFTALELADNPESEHAEWIRKKFPTSAIAVLTTTFDWADVSAGRARLVHAGRSSEAE